MHVRYTGDLRLYQSQLLLITSQKQVARFGAVAPNTEKSLECDGAQAQHHVDCRLRYKVSSGTKMMMELELKLIQTDERIAQGGKHEHELHQAASDESGRRGNEWLTDRADSNADRRRVHGRVEGEESDKVRRG